MFEPKRIAKDAISAALEKALRYRLLNEPLEAESICRDILEVEGDNQEALVTLLLALTDQFEKQFAPALGNAKELLPELQGEYERQYYAGIINERWAKGQLGRNVPGDSVYEWFREAMRCYEQAEQLSPPGEADAVLRWNTCARVLERFPHLRPRSGSMRRDLETEFGDEMPTRQPLAHND